MEYSPVVVFVYNRPKHTERCLNHLSKAHLAEHSNVYVFCDGPKNGEAFESVRETRAIVNEFKKNFKGFTVFESDENKGLANSIIGGVTEIVNKHGKVIVLEDDLLVHRDFLRYMNYYLISLQNEKQVMHISSFARNSYLQFFMPRVFLSRFMDCWGWATWSDCWRKLELDLQEIDKYLVDKRNLRHFNFSKLDYHTYFDANRVNFKTWAIFWYYTIAKNKGLCVMPKFSYVYNIGNDGSGTNEIVKTPELASNFVKHFKPYLPKIKEKKLGEKLIQDAYAKKSQKRLTTLKKWILYLLSNIRSVCIKVEF